MYIEGGKQKTIRCPVEFAGIGLHTGEEVRVQFLTAGVNTGIVFRRIDLPGKPEIAARVENVVSTERCTTIGLDTDRRVVVKTVEHIMAACWALDIDNLVIEIDGPETPVADGSSREFMAVLWEAGSRELEDKRRILTVEEPLWVREDRSYMVILPYPGFRISYTLDYKHPVLRSQFLEYDRDHDSFAEKIAGARTFGFSRELALLQKKGLARGGSLENAVLVTEDSTENPLRYQDEFVRHKILDVTGDMALNGFIAGHIIAVRTGHKLHVELAKKLHTGE